MTVHRALGAVSLSRGIERVAGAMGLTSRIGSPVIAEAFRIDA